MKGTRHDEWFSFYSGKWESALKRGRYEEALMNAIRAYMVSHDMGDTSLQIACQAYMAKAIEMISDKLDKKQRTLDKKYHRCSFCGRDEKSVRLMAGANANICEACVASIQESFGKAVKRRR